MKISKWVKVICALLMVAVLASLVAAPSLTAAQSPASIVQGAVSPDGSGYTDLDCGPGQPAMAEADSDYGTWTNHTIRSNAVQGVAYYYTRLTTNCSNPAGCHTRIALGGRAGYYYAWYSANSNGDVSVDGWCR